MEADSLYEAVVLGIGAFREHDCDPGEVGQIDVEVRKLIKHSLTLRRVQEWLAREQKFERGPDEGQAEANAMSATPQTA